MRHLPVCRAPRSRVGRAALVAALSVQLLTGCSSGSSEPVTPATAGASAATTNPTSAGRTTTLARESTTPTTTAAPSMTTSIHATVPGVDVSAYQTTEDWAGLWRSGHRFTWVKATEGSTWTSPRYAVQVAGARAVGFIVGAYHYARPARSAGALQAHHLVTVSDGWVADGRTLPGALDLEFAESGDSCHGLSPVQMASWVRDFVTAYHQLTGRAPVIYTTREFWVSCLADDRAIPTMAPLWLFDHEGEMGPWPAGWQRPLMWQRGVEDGVDRNVFLGTESDLIRFASAG